MLLKIATVITKKFLIVEKGRILIHYRVAVYRSIFLKREGSPVIFLRGLIMSLKKFLESCAYGFSPNKKFGFSCSCCPMSSLQCRSGQAIIEYFILLVLLTAISIIGSSMFFNRVHQSVTNFEGNCFADMGQEFIAPADWEEENPWWNTEKLEGGGGEGELEGGGSAPPTNW